MKKYYDADGKLKDRANAAKRDAVLMSACEYGHITVVEFLLGKGFDLSTVAEGMTALHWATAGRQVDIVNLLFERKAPLEIENCHGGTVLGEALWSAYNDPEPEDPVIIKMLIDAGQKIKPGWDKYINEVKSFYA